MNRSAGDFREYDPEEVIAHVERTYDKALADVCRRFIYAPEDMPCRPAVPEVIEQSDAVVVTFRHTPRHIPRR